MKKLIATLSVALVAGLLVLANPAQADQYQPAKVDRIQIDKKVCDPRRGDCSKPEHFVDNLGVNTHKFASGNTITFKIKVKNTGDQDISRVYVKDILPSLLTHAEGNLEYELQDLKVNEEREAIIKAQVVGKDKLPTNLTCPDNVAEARMHDKSKGQPDARDTAQVCIEGEVAAPAKELPVTGPEDTVALLGFSGVMGLAGIYLLKKYARA